MKSSKTRSMRDKMRTRAEERQGEHGRAYLVLPDGVERFKAKEGWNTLDILPYEITEVGHLDKIAEGDLWYRRLFYLHPDIGPEEDLIVCRKTVGETDAVCAEHRKTGRNPDATKEELKALRAKERELFVVIDVEDDPDKIMVWDVSTYLFGELLDEEIKDASEDDPLIFDLVGGKTLRVKFKKESGGGHSFLKASKIEIKDRDDYEDEILRDVPNLDECLTILSADVIKAKFEGSSSSDSGDERLGESESEEQPRRSRRRRSPGRATEDEPGSAADEGEHDLGPTEVECKACEGTGRSSRGTKCRACGGEGFIKAKKARNSTDESEPAEDPPGLENEEEDEKPRRRRRRRT